MELPVVQVLLPSLLKGIRRSLAGVVSAAKKGIAPREQMILLYNQSEKRGM